MGERERTTEQFNETASCASVGAIPPTSIALPWLNSSVYLQPILATMSASGHARFRVGTDDMMRAILRLSRHHSVTAATCRGLGIWRWTAACGSTLDLDARGAHGRNYVKLNDLPPQVEPPWKLRPSEFLGEMLFFENKPT